MTTCRLFGALVLLLVAGGDAIAGDLVAERRAAAHRARRIIMNNDGNDCRKPGLEHTVAGFLESRTSPLAGSQVDAIFYCTGVFNFYTHKSDETEPRQYGDKNAVDWAWELTEQGTDSLREIISYCHGHGMEAFWSMRMNDTHDSGDQALLCQWKQAHPEYLMGRKGDKFPHGGGRWSAVNYELPEVREKVFRILRDVCTRYDVDGLELDFYRHPVYFKPQMTGAAVTQAQCDLLTELVRRVRAMADEEAARRGRPVLLAVRVPDSVGFAKGIGIDLVRWLEDGLVDIVVGGGYFHFEPWKNLVALCHGHDVPVYPCLSGSRIVSDSAPESGGGDAALLARWRNEAAAAWRAGADGVYTFNLFSPASPLFRELGSLETLPGADAAYEPLPGNKKAMERWLKGGSGYLRPLAGAQKSQ